MTVAATQRHPRRVRTRTGIGGNDCERPSAAARPALDAPSLFTDLGGEPTLDEMISSAWEGLAAHHHVPCPLCGGEMAAVFGAHARPAEGRCGDCGTTFS
jgi:hypothetical protein